MLARYLAASAPALAETLERTRFHRVIDLTDRRTALMTTRGFRTPQHTMSRRA